MTVYVLVCEYFALRVYNSLNVLVADICADDPDAALDVHNNNKYYHRYVSPIATYHAYKCKAQT